jgi:hypothetical protein
MVEGERGRIASGALIEAKEIVSDPANVHTLDVVERSLA